MAKKKSNLYLSDKPPLNFAGKVGLGISYAILTLWSLLIIVPLLIMVISSFNGNQQQNIIIDFKEFVFSFKQFKILFTQTDFLRWVVNTIFIAIATAVLTLLVVSYTGYVYSRFRFKGKRVSLMAIM